MRAVTDAMETVLERSDVVDLNTEKMDTSEVEPCSSATTVTENVRRKK